ncbi:hypothetical protein Goarm_021623, partial [Gossypium armourianum]|nr:hypothetical protein [Gossypium armourianum]
IELPPWTDVVKGGKLKELPPYDPDWYYIRAGGYMGGAKRNGSRSSHFCNSSGSIARHILQQLQNVNIIDLDTKGARIGKDILLTVICLLGWDAAIILSTLVTVARKSLKIEFMTFRIIAELALKNL